MKYTKEYLAPIVASSRSISEVIRKCGCKPSGGMHRLIRERIRQHGIDNGHIDGQGWSKGKVRPHRVPDSEVFCENSTTTGGQKLRPRMIRAGFEYKCAECALNEWCGKEITLHVDHINGVNNDNRKENLRFLCPNCHQQTPTWGNKT